MGFKKYEEGMKTKEEIALEEENKKIEEEKALINNVIEENAKLEEEAMNAEKTVDENKVVEDVEVERAIYKKVLKKRKIIGIITSCLGLAMMVVAMILMFTLKNSVSYIGIISLLIAAVGGVLMLVMSVVKSKILKKKALDYVNKYLVITNKFVFSSDDFTNVEYLADKQFNDNAFRENHLYKDIRETRSRNYVASSYKGIPLVSCDIAANILVKNKTSPAFLGKLYVLKRDIKKPEPIIEKKENEETNEETKKDPGTIILFQLKGGELSKPIDNIEDLEKVDDSQYYVVYSNDHQYKKIFNSKVLNLAKSFRIDKTLIDVLISIRDEYITIGIDYVDDFISIPIESEVKIEYLRRTKTDLEIVTNIFDAINENSK